MDPAIFSAAVTRATFSSMRPNSAMSIWGERGAAAGAATAASPAAGADRLAERERGLDSVTEISFFFSRRGKRGSAAPRGWPDFRRPPRRSAAVGSCSPRPSMRKMLREALGMTGATSTAITRMRSSCR